MYSVSTPSNDTPAPSFSSRKPSPKMYRGLATLLALSIPLVANAETRLVKVGNPVFEVTGGIAAIPATNPTPGSFEPWLDNIAIALEDVRQGEHITIRNACHDCPLEPHDGPYDQEVRQGLVEAGYLITDAFIQGELASPATLLFPVVLTPGPDAPTGTSFESPNGPVIPNDIFPIRTDASIFNGGTNLGTATRRVKALDRNVGEFTDRFGETHDLDFNGLNYSHLALFNFNARHPGGSANNSQQRVGNNHVVNKIRDANGNGWDLIEDYTIVAEATGIPGDLNYNGELDMGDLNIMTQNVALMPTEGHEFSKDQLRLDVNGDELVNVSDVHHWVTDLKSTWIGDANLDGVFDSGDFVDVFKTGKYETGETARWNEGDWNGDELFDSGDFVAAFKDGGYELGPRTSVAAVPEPSSLLLLMLGMLGIGRLRRR